MRVGSEDRQRLIAAIVLMVVAAIAVFYVFFRPETPAPAVATKSPAPAVKGRPGRRAPVAAVTAAESLDPTLRLGLLRSSEGVNYEGAGRNIFRAQADEPLPKPTTPPLKDDKTLPKPPPGPPPPPPINLKFYGFANTPGGSGKKVFLSEGDTIFIAGEGDVVNRRYKVVKIGQSSVEIEDLLNNNKQTIPLT
ncbi:MAG TPA: hypothetical protein VMS96_08995 [Terriglobales bacterium]|nr:hypothetical protein [Terriglobales bacterium]